MCKRHTLCILSALAQHSNKSERFRFQASSPKVAFRVSFPAKACSSSILLSSSWWRLRVHALLSDRELSIHSHHPGLLVKLTEGFCNQSVNMKLIHTPIRPMIEKRAVSGFHLEFCIKVFILLQQFWLPSCFLTHQISSQNNDKLPFPHIYASCHDYNKLDINFCQVWAFKCNYKKSTWEKKNQWELVFVAHLLCFLLFVHAVQHSHNETDNWGYFLFNG